MSLIDRLSNAAHQLPPSHTVDFAQVGQVLGAIVQFLEHGDAFLDAAEDPEQGALGFLTEHADQVNEQTRSDQADEAAQQAPQGTVTSAPAVPIGQAPGPAFSPPAHVGQPFTPPGPVPGTAPDQLTNLLGQLLGELQAERAERAGRDRMTVTTPDADAESSPQPTPATPPEPGPGAGVDPASAPAPQPGGGEAPERGAFG